MKKLKDALEFQASEKSRLDSITSSQEFLLYLYEVILFKFRTLKEVGVLSSESSLAIDAVNQKLEIFVTEPKSNVFDPQAVERENQVLKKTLSDLRSKYVKSGIVTEREIELQKEVEFMKRKEAKFKTSLKDARKKIDELSPVHAMVSTLRTKNSLLISKIDHQARLLRTLTAGQPEQKALVTKAGKLENENRRLRDELEKQSYIVRELSNNNDLDSPAKQMLGELVNENQILYSELTANDIQFETLSNSTDESLIDKLDRLHEENLYLRSLIKSKEAITDSVENDTDNHSRIADILREQNEAIRNALVSKKEQIKLMSLNPFDQKMMKSLGRFTNEIIELKKVNELNEHFCRHLQDEKKVLQGKTRDNAAYQKQVRQLNLELEKKDQILKSLEKTEQQYNVLKKEHSAMRLEYEKATAELNQIRPKIAGLTADHDKVRQMNLEIEKKDLLIESYRKTEQQYNALRKDHSTMRLKYEKAVMELNLDRQKITRLTNEYNNLVKEYEMLFGNSR